ncbi:hypothetical protein [Candidatus Marinarcus aquaticus]|uniref:hypothetical protein n=1 Tax=Candidatus Marinarcus aquaticus TaxID=2044504 RepID=UPI00100B786A|nr:hypothetical protein [Candidatus Marinarcus aquaticus]
MPHLDPVRFAQSIIACEQSHATVKCEFPSIPTLSMFFEAAAQSSAAFAQDGEAKIGFVISLKAIQLLNKMREQTAVLEVKKEVELGAVCEFSFMAYDASMQTKLAQGSFTVMLSQ